MGISGASGKRIGANHVLRYPSGVLAVKADYLHPFALQFEGVEAYLMVHNGRHLALGAGGGA